MVTKITIGGKKTGSANNEIRSVRVRNSPTWINCRQFSFAVEDLIGLKINAKSEWDIKLTASSISGSTYSLVPLVKIDYIFPIR